MSKALRLPSSNETRPTSFDELTRQLDAAEGAKYEMSVADSLWAQEGEPLQATFLDRVSRHHRGEVHLVDFRHSSDPSRLAINGWVDRNAHFDHRGQEDRRIVSTPIGGS
jgi:serpin B